MLEMILGVLHFIAIVYAFYNILSSRAPGLTKLLWCLAVFFLPFLGLIAWFFLGPKKG